MIYCLRAGRWWLVLLLAVLVPQAAATPWLRIDAKGLDADEAAASEALLALAESYLPPAWRVVPVSAIAPTLHWRDGLPQNVHGRSLAQRVLLRKDLLRDWDAHPTGSKARAVAQRAALAALIHELAHLHDRGAQAGLSRDPRLLDLAGWQQQPLRFGRRLRDNRFSDRSPDRYELHNPREFVAVNLEWFLLDRQYACRRPALYRYFSERLQWQAPTAVCAAGQWFLQADADAAIEGLEQIDPRRVYAVDYLLAEGNHQTMSRWGHSMLRLVICAPGRTPGPDCRLDLQYHRVMSFRAFVGDVQISSWRGLTGRYPSRLFLLSLDQVVDEYTKTELRGLQSIPLQLDAGEISDLLERAAQLHWTYDGRYYFISNNCAVETWKLLHDALPRLAAKPLRSITPNGLLHRLERNGVANAKVLDDRAEAMRLGYYFESMGARYQAMYQLAHTALGLPQDSVEQWLEASPEARAPWLGKAGLREGAALLLLEEAALRREELQVRDGLKRQLFGAGAVDSRQANQVRADLDDVLAREALLVRPAALDGEGYGLPQQEQAQLQARASTLAKSLKEDWRALHRQARESLSVVQRERLAGIEKNLSALGTRLRELNRDQGGLQLPARPVD